MRRTTEIAAVLCLSAAMCGSAGAQDYPRYTPSRPTLSPYLNLTTPNRGVLPNYFSLVRPLQTQRSIDTRLTAAAQAQARTIRNLSQLTAAPPASQGTGTASVYRQYSHFYPRLSGGRR